MAQAISNTTQKTNPFSIFSTGSPLFQMPSMKTANSTPMTIGIPNTPLNFGSSLMPQQKTQTGGLMATPTASKPTSLGSYKGVPINPGTQEQIMAQMRAIDGQSAPSTTQQTTAPAPVQASTMQQERPVKGVLSYPGLVGSLAGASTPGKKQTGLVKSLEEAAAQNRAIAEEAQRISDEYGKQIAEVGRLGAGAMAGNLSTGTNVVGAGNAAIASQSASARMAALAAGQEAALKGTGQQLTAQQQLASALEGALGGTNVQQAQQLSGLGAAAGLAAPSTAAYGQTVFNPLTGQYEGGGGLPPEVMQQYAQLAATGQYASIPSFITSNPVLNAQLNVAARMFNPNYTPVGAAGASSVLQTIPALKSAETAAEGIKNTIVTYLAQNPQLNPSDLAAGNILQQWIQGKQLTDPKYQTLFNYLNEYTNTLAPILGVGGDATNLKTQIAQSFVNAAASGQSITQVLNALSQLAQNKVSDLERGAVGQGTTVPAFGGSTGGFAETW